MPVYHLGDELRGHILEEKLGDGAMGDVWRARHAHLRKAVAIKALHPDLCTDAEAIRRFFREAQVVNSLNHPHIVSIIDFVDELGQPPYIIMEFLEGVSLEDLITPEALLPLPDCLEIARQIADAMASVHDGGFVHRDLKPDNVFVQRIDGAPSIKLLDFGLARFQLDTYSLLRTQTGSILGTPMYMSPEQIRGQAVDHRTDIYSMGCILYGLLTGDPPFIDEQVGVVLKNHLHERPTSPTRRVDATRAAAIPAVVERATLRCLEKAPQERVQSMEELAHLLAEVQHSQTPAKIRSAAPAFARDDTSTTAVMAALSWAPHSGDPASRRRRSRPWVAVAVAALLLCGGVAALIWSRTAPHEKGRDEPHHTDPTTPPPPMNAGPVTGPRTGRSIRVVSIPAGAALVNPRTGQTLWTTPAHVQLPVDRPRQLSVELAGHEKLILTLTPQTVGPVEIELQRISALGRRGGAPTSRRRRQTSPPPRLPTGDTDTVNPFQ